jgi:TPR repeat protein
MALLEKAAGQGHAYAMSTLGDIHGLWKEHVLAAEWFAKGAEAGLPGAMFSLASCLELGEGVAALDYPAAADLYRCAADAGIGAAAANLSQMYTVGRGRAGQMMPATFTHIVDPRFLSLGLGCGILRRDEHYLPGPRARRHAQQAAGDAVDAQGRRERQHQGMHTSRLSDVRGPSLRPRGWKCCGGRRGRPVGGGHGGAQRPPGCPDQRGTLAAKREA